MTSVWWLAEGLPVHLASGVEQTNGTIALSAANYKIPIGSNFTHKSKDGQPEL